MKKLFSYRYVVVRRDDMSVVAEMDCFPDSDRATWRREGRRLNVRALQSDERIVSQSALREIVQEFISPA